MFWKKSIKYQEETYISPEYIKNNLADELKNRNILLLGAPSIGKTHEIIKAFKDKNVLFICENGGHIANHRPPLKYNIVSEQPANKNNIIDASKFDFIILDDIYKIILEQETLGSLNDFLKKKSGLCIITTPYRWEWLLKEKKFKEYGQKITESCKLYKIPEEIVREELKNIIKKSEEISEDKIKELVEKALTKLKYTYKFDNGALRKKAKSYEAYVCPRIFSKFKSVDEKVLLPLTDFGYTFFEHSYLEGAGEILHKLLEEHEIKNTLTTIATLIGGVALPLTIAYAIFTSFQKKKEKSSFEGLKESFGILFQLEDHELEMIEKANKLPPLSLITSKRILSTPAKWEETEKAIDRIAGIIKNNEELKNELDKKFKRFDENLRKLNEKLNEIYKEHKKIAEFIDKNLIECVLEVDKIYNTLSLHELKSRDLEIPQDAKIVPKGRDDLLDELIKEIKDKRKLIILKGPAGVGKTTVAYLLSQRLSAEYFVGVPDFKRSIEFLEEFLKRRLAVYHDKGCVLFSEWEVAVEIIDEKRSVFGINHDNIEKLNFLLRSEWCDSVVLVCRSEYYYELEEKLRNRLMGKGTPGISSIINNKLVKEIEPLKSENDIEKILQSLWEPYEEKWNLVRKQMSNIKRVAQMKDAAYNPLFAILASSWAARKEKNLAEMTSDSFIKDYVEEIFFRSDMITKEAQLAFKIISSAKIIHENYLVTILGYDMERLVDKESWNSKIKPFLQSYVYSENIRIYRIEPAKFADVIFYFKCLDDLDDFINKFKKFPYSLAMLAYNIQVAWDIKNEDKVLKRANDFINKINDISPEIYFTCLRFLVLGGLPVELKYVNVDKLMSGAETDTAEAKRFAKILEEILGKKIEIKHKTELTVIMPFILKLILNHVFAEKGPNGVVSNGEDFAFFIAEKLNKVDKRFDMKGFMISFYYCLTISKIADIWEPQDKQNWIDDIEKKAAKAVEKFRFPITIEKFMEYVYSMNMGFFLIHNDRQNWIDDIEKRAAKAVEKFGIPTTVEKFMGYVYSLTISMIATQAAISNWKTHDTQNWIDIIEIRAAKSIDKFGIPTTIEKFMGHFYSNSILQIANNEDRGLKESYMDYAENENMYLFCWEEIPGKESGRLIDFLKQNYSVDWVKTAKIDNDGKTICVTAETDKKHFILLNLNNEKTEVNINIDDHIIDKFIAKIENGKLNIYEDMEFHDKQNWINDIEKRAAKSVEKFGIPITKEKFMGHFYSLSIYMITENWEPQDKQDLINDIEKRAAKSVEKFGIPTTIEKFMGHFYSLSIYMIAENWEYQDKQDWIDFVEYMIDNSKIRLSAAITKELEKEKDVVLREKFVKTLNEIWKIDLTQFKAFTNREIAVHLNNSFSQTKNPHRLYQWYISFLERNILALFASQEDINIISEFVFNFIWLTMNLSSQKRKDLELLFYYIERIKERNLDIFKLVMQSYIISISTCKELGVDRKILLTYALGKAKLFLIINSFDLFISTTLIEMAHIGLKDKELGEILFDACWDAKVVLGKALDLIELMPKKEFCKSFLGLCELLPSKILEDCQVFILLERAKKEKGC
jgi:DNA polymerase III delta prime subunit